jgi:hypothetical protein
VLREGSDVLARARLHPARPERRVLARWNFHAADGRTVHSALLLTYLPAGVVALLRIVVPATELVLAFALVMAPDAALPRVMMGAALLLVAFTIWMATALVQGIRVRCGCFGAGHSRIGAPAVLRNAILLGMALIGTLLAGRFASPLPDPSFGMLVLTTSGMLSLMLIVAFRFGRPALLLSMADSLPEEDVSPSIADADRRRRKVAL